MPEYLNEEIKITPETLKANSTREMKYNLLKPGGLYLKFLKFACQRERDGECKI